MEKSNEIKSKFFFFKVLKKSFAMFDQGKTGLIETGKLITIFNTLGQAVDSDELDKAIAEQDKESQLFHVVFCIE